MICNLYWVFDVRTSDTPGWHAYDKANYPPGSDSGFGAGGAHLGQNELPDFYEQHPSEWVQQALDEALGDIASRVGPGLQGIRIRVWQDRSYNEVPDMIVEATPRQLAQARIRAATYIVHRAQQDLQEAQDALRETVVDADLAAPLGRTPEEAVELINEDVEEALPGEVLAPFLAGARLALQLRGALMARGLSGHCFDADLETYEQQFGGVHSYWAGCIRFLVRLDGTVVVTLHPDGEPSMRLALADPEAEKRELEATRAAERQLASKHAATLAKVLNAWRVSAHAEDGSLVEDAQLAAISSFTLLRTVSSPSNAAV